MKRTVGVALTTALALSSILPSVAFAGFGPYRYFHGEPMNNLTMTPGATFAVSVATICHAGYSSSVRDVPESEKNRVYAEYGITHRSVGQYEIDHLISLELGGSNTIGNLWPEPNDHPHGYLNSKDILENRLHDFVCSGKVDLHSVQTSIAHNWVSLYHEFMGTWPNAKTSGTSMATSTSVKVSNSTTTTVRRVGEVRIMSIERSVAPGAHEVLAVSSSKPNDLCNLTVTLPSGRQSTEKGLGTVRANSRGAASWSWLIGPTTGAGTARASVTCSTGTVAVNFTIN